MLALAIAAVLCAARPATAGDDDDWGGRTFQGEPGDWRPLDSMPDESMPKESMPRESMPLDRPMDSRITDSEDDEGPAVAPEPRLMIGDDDDGDTHHHHHHKPRAGELREAIPVDGSGVQPAPRAVEPLGTGPTD